MKIHRNKKFKKIIQYYKNNFGFREPFQILVDATFCFTALKNKVNIKDQLDHVFETELKLLTTACMIIETEKLGHKLSKVTMIMKKFAIHKCGHKDPVSGSSCFRSMVKSNRYILATQDRELQEWIRKQVGQPLVYLHQVTPVLEAPSDKSKDFADQQMDEKVNVQKLETKTISILRMKEGFVEPEVQPKKKKKSKQPNPLSCKKKKAKVHGIDQTKPNTSVNKNAKKGKKVKIPRHLRDHIKILKMTGND